MKHKSVVAASLHPANGSGTTQNHRGEGSPPEEVIELNIVIAKTASARTLSTSERARLEECEGILERGLGTFYEVGSALLSIQEGRWYRSTHSSFEEYCRDRWNIGRSYASRVIGAAERLKLLSGAEPLPRPANEFQMRPFLKLEPEVFPGAWKYALKAAQGGKVTAGIVRAVIRELLPNGSGRKQSGKRRKRSRSKTKLPKGQFLVLLNEAKRHVQQGNTDKALAALERIENWLFKA